MKNNKLYVCTAYRFGNNKNHSYTIGIFSTKTKAFNAAELEANERGGKYQIWVAEYELDNYDKNHPTCKIVYKTKQP